MLKLLASGVVALGLFGATSFALPPSHVDHAATNNSQVAASEVAKPTCCMKHAYCCTVQRPCCR